MIILRKFRSLSKRLMNSYRILKFKLKLSPNIHLGKNVQIERFVNLSTENGGKIFIGDCCQLSQGVQLLTHGGDIYLGNNCTINPHSVIYGQGGTRIGNAVRIAAHCTIVSANHIFKNKDIEIYKQGLSKIGVTIDDDVWLGTGVKVLDGVYIGKGCVIGAGSVVTKSTDPYSIYVGIPAKKIKGRGE